MDPVTAALNAIAEFNRFLSTPEGQKLAAANRGLIERLLGKLHLKLAPDDAASAPSPAH